MLTSPMLAAAPSICAWIRFDDGARVTVLSGRVELGQGNMTALLQMAADELDVDVGRVSIVGGDTRRTPNEGFTSGSLSVVQGGVALRLAASAARHVLLARAATLLQADVADLSIADGCILRDGAPTDLDLWKLARETDLDLPVVDHADPKPPSARRVVGTSVPRVDLAARISGTPFVHDIQCDGMLHGRPVHPPSMRATLTSLDLDAIRARPGIVAVVRDGQFVGIVAETEYAALRAAQWAETHAVWDMPTTDIADPIAAIAVSTEEAQIVHETGDVEAAEGREYATTVSKPYISHGSIGPSAAVAVWEDGRLSVWSHTQGVFPLRAALAQVFDMPPDDIDVTHCAGAGCYGHNGADDAALDAALMARAVSGRPVKVVWRRADEFRFAPLGPGMSTTVKATVDAAGRIAALEVMANSAPHGNRPGRAGSPNLRAAAYLEKPFPPARSNDIALADGGGADRNAIPAYDAPNMRVGKRVVHAMPYRTSSMRGLGAYLNIYAIETLMDRIAAEIGQDPIDFRLANLSDPRGRAVIEKVREDARATVDGPSADGSGWGLGYARYKNTAAYCAIIARVEVEDTVKVTDVFAALDTGEIINPDGAINQTEGGILQSMSWTLKEAIRFDGAAVATESWEDYPILRFTELPNVRVSLIDRPDEPPLGCAEAAQGPMAAALGNAVFNAIGVPVRKLPLDRDNLVDAAMNA